MSENNQVCIECGRKAVIIVGGQAVQLGRITSVDLAEFRGAVVRMQGCDGSLSYGPAASAEAIVTITCDASAKECFVTVPAVIGADTDAEGAGG